MSLLFLWICLSLPLGGFSSSISVANVCARIRAIESNSTFFPGSSEYLSDISHFAISAEQNSTCSVEPATTSDVGKILTILGSTRTPFAVKGGGHNLNPGFSSTTGVQISMARFNEITYHQQNQTVDVGPALLWDEVYEALEPYNVTVVGGRATGVGIAGFLLGGGYSYKTNQYGLSVDSVTEMELVLPNGQVKTITPKSDSDLFFALRGGGNNFGIVTKWTLKTYPQTEVWGGSIIYPANQSQIVAAALLNYTTTVTDVKTGLQCTFATYQGQGLVMLNLFYNAPTPPQGIFDAFLNISAASTDIGTRTYVSLVQSANTQLTANTRGVYNTISHTAVTSNLLAAIINETNYYSNALSNDSLVLNGYVIEPFVPSAYHHETSESAYPPYRSQNVHPMNIYYAWTDAASDDKIEAATRASASHLQNIAVAENILGKAKYNNYALFGTAIQDLYGINTNRLRQIKSKVDPSNIMGLAGGFKF